LHLINYKEDDGANFFEVMSENFQIELIYTGGNYAQKCIIAKLCKY